MFSVTKTGMWRLPLCTPNVIPTICGVIVERRDQVRIAGGFGPPLAIRLRALCRLRSIKGPFLSERGIPNFEFRISNFDLLPFANRHSQIANYLRLLSRTIMFCVRLLRR